MRTIRIGSRQVGEGCPAYVIAELSCNHRQDYSIAERTIAAIAAAGADAIKLQTCTPEGLTLDCSRDEFMIKGGTPWDGRTLFDLYTETQTPWDWHAPLQEFATSLGLDFFASPFDLEAVEFLSKLDVPAYKIASFEAVDPQLIRAVARQGKPVIISTGIASEEDLDIALGACRSVGNDQMVLLKCTSAYPAPIEAANLLQIPELANRFDCPAGLSDHTHGWLVPVGAVALGACIVEKHVILNRDLGGPDAGFSMEPDEFAEMVGKIREMEKALGSSKLQLNGATTQQGRAFARSLFAVEDIEAGESISTTNVRSIRPGCGLAPKELDKVVGMRAKERIERGTPLSWELVE